MAPGIMAEEDGGDLMGDGGEAMFGLVVYEIIDLQGFAEVAFGLFVGAVMERIGVKEASEMNLIDEAWKAAVEPGAGNVVGGSAAGGDCDDAEILMELG